MDKCGNCNKAVYFAEKISSLGKSWHRACFKCANNECNKVLTAGNHSEHEGKPYCNRCHSALFGIRGYGHGGTESHVFLQSTGKI